MIATSNGQGCLLGIGLRLSPLEFRADYYRLLCAWLLLDGTWIMLDLVGREVKARMKFVIHFPSPLSSDRDLDAPYGISAAVA